MAKWKCEICGNEFDNFHAQGFDNKIYCPLCYFKKENRELKNIINQIGFEPDEIAFLQQDNAELKKQVEEYQQELEKADSITQSCIFNGKEESKISYRKCLNILDKKETQQKEFIKFLEDNYKETQDIWYIEILQKYKSIIGDDK